MTFLLGMMTGIAMLSGLAWIAAFAVEDSDEGTVRPEPDTRFYCDSL